MKCQRDAAGCEMRLFLPSCRPTQEGRKRTSLGYLLAAHTVTQDGGGMFVRVLLEFSQAGGTRAMQHYLPGVFADVPAAKAAIKTLFR